MPPSALPALFPLALLLAALLTPALTRLPLAASPPVALGLPLLPLLVPLLPLLVHLPLERSWGPSPQRLSATHVSAQAKAPNLSLILSKEPSKRRLCPSQFSECRSPMDPIPFAVAAAPPGVHILPSLQPGLPISRSQPFKCHQSALQRFFFF